MKQLIEKIYKKTALKDECVEWTGAVSKNGYGQIGHNYKIFYCHRIVFSIEKNQVLTSTDIIMHTCDNRKCVNINHLKKGTQRENIEDCVNKKRNHKYKKFCVRGHERTEDNLILLKSGSRACKACQKMRIR